VSNDKLLRTCDWLGLCKSREVSRRTRWLSVSQPGFLFPWCHL